MERKRSELFKFLLSMLLFGTNGIWVTSISLSSAQIVLTRTFLGSIFLFLVVVIGKDASIKKIKYDMVPTIFAGICLGVNWVLLFEAYKYASVSIGTLIYYCGPMIVLALSPFLFKEKLTWNKLVAIVAVVIGMICITGISGTSSTSSRGIIAGAGAACFYAGLIISNKYIKNISGVVSTFVQLLVAFVVILIYLLIKSEFPFEIPGGKELVYILILGVINSGLACWLYFSSMQKLPGQTVALCCYLDPMSAVVFSAMFLGERMIPLQILGAVLILGGAIFGELKFKSQKQVNEG